MAVVAPESVIRVEVPASPDVLHLLRTVTASIGARMMMSLDEVEDLRIAVDEAATILLARADGTQADRALELALTCSDHSVTASISLDPVRSTPDDEVQGSWSWRVISAVADDASIDRTGARMTITFGKSAPGPGR
jgi:serine/threonine-protein kinase RsbW